MSEQAPPFHGKFRGIVTDNRDPSNLGRVRARVPDVLGDKESGWALPALPYAGNQVGLFLIPPQNASVWIEFEHGDPDYPVWTGCFWAENQLPPEADSADKKILKTNVATITLNDGASSGITIETTDGLKIKMDTWGIEISNGGQRILISSTSVSVNDGALEVV